MSSIGQSVQQSRPLLRREVQLARCTIGYVDGNYACNFFSERLDCDCRNVSDNSPRDEDQGLTWLPFEVSSLKSACSLRLERLGIGDQRGAALAKRMIRWSFTLSVCFTIWGSWWRIERIAFHLDHTSSWWSKICAFERSCSLGTDFLLGSWCSLHSLCIHLCLFCRPFWRKSTLIWRKVTETLKVVTVPEIELEVLGGVFDVD